MNANPRARDETASPAEGVAQGFSPFLAQHLSHVAEDYRNGIFAGTNDIVERVGGKKPTTVEEFITANSAAFAD